MSDMDARIVGIVTTLIVLQLHCREPETSTITNGRSRAAGHHGTYSVRVTKHTHTAHDDEPAAEVDVEMNPVKHDDPIKSSDWS
ncbi:hypothetical protein FRB95_007127 [Tulasnella sp. JGI-2019a]|nr:hypothetical protein FRB95_007127 [Tulasnella sp. JGI-2019a]